MAAWFPYSALPLLWRTRAHPSSRTLLPYPQRLTATGKSTGDGAAVLSPATIHRVEEEVLRTIRAQGLSLDKLLVDTTNVFTYHRDGGLHRKGHSKERRYDKIEIPSEDLILVFDRGVNSTDNFDDVVGTMHVIAAVNRQEARVLFQVPLDEFHGVAQDGEGKPILGYPATWHEYGRTWRTLVIYREATAKPQQSRWESTKKKVLDQVAKWCTSLGQGAPGKSQRALLRKMVELIPRDYHGVFDYGVEKEGAKVWPRCIVPEEAEARLRRSWGKAMLITDLSEEKLPNASLVEGYVARAGIEEDFK